VTVRHWVAAGFIGLALVGCATPSRPTPTRSAEQMAMPEWQGRIGVNVQGDAPSSMSASFALRGNASTGELDLYSPFGTALGALQWTPQLVQLSDGKQHQYFNSLAELTEKTTGAALPIDAIFDWLQGRATQVAGWQADLSHMSEGALFARRTDPSPEVTLRIKLEP
jgi:outer membrane lipoprotein LolB